MVVDGQEILGIRYSKEAQNYYFTCYVGQMFRNGSFVSEIYKDLNEFIQSGNNVIVVKKQDKEGGEPYTWQEFNNPTDLQVTYKEPDEEENQRLIKELLNQK